MKTPIEALDEAINVLRDIRADLIRADVVEACKPFTGSINPFMLHFYRPDSQAVDKLPPIELARALGGKWLKSPNGTWENAPEGFPEWTRLFIHNAEPARNPQPEAVEL